MFKLFKPKGGITAPAILALSAFTLSATADELPVEATADMVEYCESLGMVTGHSGYGKHGGVHWERIAKGRALRKADSLGATHIIWEKARPNGAFNGHVTGSIYECE
ncbi:hypothetical protein [Methylocaldum szegediense]|uniref:DUF4148 domain-containing protein n=1 Tax=Methylocaldum szegediense TaxID=73780 RepID=A0ABN8X640_9GAMM|nr:hypothetical protein [Methylocaldum szegediense]CAI8812869.1 conserved exported protein of unknown function [Methylocaldum szegediense]